MPNALVDLLVAKRAVLGVDGGAGRRRGYLCLGYVGAEQALTEIKEPLPREDESAQIAPSPTSTPNKKRPNEIRMTPQT